MTYQIPGGLLGAKGNPADDFTVALYNEFAAAHADVWARFTLRQDVIYASSGVPRLGLDLFTLIFDQMVLDPAYYGDWWQYGGMCLAGTISHPSDNLYYPTAGPFGGGTLVSGPTINGLAPYTQPYEAEVYDLRMLFVSNTANSARFTTEAWWDGVQRHVATWDVSVDAGKTPFAGCQGIRLINQYGNSWNMYFDDVSVGTTQGASDILAVQSFDDLTFGAFTVDPGDETTGTRDSFFITKPPAGPRYIKRHV